MDQWLTFLLIKLTTLIIQSTAPDDMQLNEFNDYLVENWFDSSTISKEMWNFHNKKHQTNNIVEEWNHKFKTLIGRSHLSIWVLIEKLKIAAAERDHRLLRIELNLEGAK